MKTEKVFTRALAETLVVSSDRTSLALRRALAVLQIFWTDIRRLRPAGASYAADPSGNSRRRGDGFPYHFRHASDPARAGGMEAKTPTTLGRFASRHQWHFNAIRVGTVLFRK